MDKYLEDEMLYERFLNNNNFMEQEDFALIGDEHITVGVPRYIPMNLKKQILAVIKSEALGCTSVDYTLNKYGGEWKLDLYYNEKDKLLAQIIKCVREQIGITLKRMVGLNKINTNGLIISRAVLFRLQNSFKSVLLLIRKGYFLEAINLCRLILEQTAWAYEIHELNEDRIIKTNITKSISKLKRLYSTAGKFYGALSKSVHISPELTPEYIWIDECKCNVVLRSTKDFSQSLYNILVLTDIYCSSIEFVFRNYLDDFYFLNKEEGFTLDIKRDFKKKIIFFEELLFNLSE